MSQKIKIILTGVMGEEHIEFASDFREAENKIETFFDEQIEEYNLDSYLHGNEYFYRDKWNRDGRGGDYGFNYHLLTSSGDRLPKRYRENSVHSYKEPKATCFTLPK
jgi:hypothetical protein